MIVIIKKFFGAIDAQIDMGLLGLFWNQLTTKNREKAIKDIAQRMN